MGTSNSCLPVSFAGLQTLTHRHSLSRLKVNAQVTEENNNAIKINDVSEDTLLLLPGVTRPLAKNLIDYRERNQGFKHINELLQVTGINHDLFNRIRSDVSIDVSSQALPKTSRGRGLTNLNLASHDDLCAVPGLTPALATRIIQRRERKGVFRFIEDLLEVKGVDYIVLATARRHVTVENPAICTSVSHSSVNHLYPTLNRSHSKPADTLSLASILLDTLPTELQTILLSSPPQRPTAVHFGRSSYFRFASWNLQQLTVEKVRNPGVREVVCRIILENDFSLIGVQGIGHRDSLSRIVEELNNPIIPSLKSHSGPSPRKWACMVGDEPVDQMCKKPEYLGFIYDQSIEMELKKASFERVQTAPSLAFYAAVFRFYDKLDVVFVNAHLNVGASSLPMLMQTMKETMGKNSILFGDFNLEPATRDHEFLVNCNYASVIHEPTDVTLDNLQGSKCTDSIWLSTDATALSTGNLGVIRENLTSMWIPTGWTWGGLVSDHCPIWMELNVS